MRLAMKTKELLLSFRAGDGVLQNGSPGKVDILEKPYHYMRTVFLEPKFEIVRRRYIDRLLLMCGEVVSASRPPHAQAAIWKQSCATSSRLMEAARIHSANAIN